MQEAELIETLPEGEVLPETPKALPAQKKYDRSIIEGPLGSAVWNIAWPAIFTNLFSGVQSWVDQIMVGNLIGYQANAAIGAAFQIFILVIVFISSVFIGMSVLVARFVGAGDHERANRAVYQGFLTAIVMSLGILAPVGYFSAPYLLQMVSSDATVIAEALPFLRIMFVFSTGMMIYFMLSGALRSAGDARTPMVLGVVMTVLNLLFNIILIRGFGPIPAFGTAGAAMGTCLAAGLVGVYSIWRLIGGGWVVSFPKGGYAPDWKVIKQLFKFGLPAGFQGIAMNIGGVMMYWFMGNVAQSAAVQAVYAVSYSQLFSLVTWGSNALMGASAAVAGQNLGAGNPDRAKAAVHTAARIGVAGAVFIGLFFFFFPTQLLGIFGMKDPAVLEIGANLLRVLSVSGIFISAALAYTGGLQGTGDTKGPLYISIVSQVIIPLGICFIVSKTTDLQAMHIWLAILAGHMTRCVLSFLRFQQGKWRSIKVELDHTAA
ncbi:MAG TPA: MATE family efflux transporter [Pyrinomonadaceae bacterium]|jgi:putative MATE family efflux protein|nr:MATE family efflux transporter [Pyrinomonadaceae bacterium]